MKRIWLIPHATFAAAVLAGFLFTSVPARAEISVHIDIGNAPPAPHFVFRARPHEVYIPERRVYVVDDPGFGDNDCFRYGGYYWLFRDGYWYRCPTWRGRFVVVNPRYVPTVFYQVPPTRWKHRPSGPPEFVRNSGGPPGQRRDGGPPGKGGPPGQEKKGDKGGDKGRGHGK